MGMRQCVQCGRQDIGTYCSNCGAALGAERSLPHSLFRTVVTPIWDCLSFNAIAILQPDEAVRRVRSGKLGYDALFRLALASVGLTGLIAHLAKVSSPVLPDAGPILSDLITIVILSGALLLLSFPLHLFLRRPGSRFGEYATLVVCVLFSSLPYWVATEALAEFEIGLSLIGSILTAAVALSLVPAHIRIISTYYQRSWLLVTGLYVVVLFVMFCGYAFMSGVLGAVYEATVTA